MQPSDLTKNAGSTASFSVTALGASPLAFQWLKNGQPLNDGLNISGSQTATLTVSNVLGGDAGQYSVLVTNSMGAQTSQEASLTGLSFDGSSAGTNWLSLGEANRIPGGWQLESPALLTSIAIHAGAYARAGFNNGSAELVETTLRPLKILHVTSSAGSTSNLFAFTYSGPPGQNVVVESSADFQTWLPL